MAEARYLSVRVATTVPSLVVSPFTVPCPSASSSYRMAYSDRHSSCFSTPELVGFRELSGRQLNDLAIEREGRFGTLEFSWAVRNCFVAWQRLLRDRACLYTLPGADSGHNKTRMGELDAIAELQSALLDREGVIRNLQQRYAVCECERDCLAAELEEFDRHRHLHGEALEKHSRIQQEAADKYAELEQVATSRYYQLQDASKKHAKLQEEFDRHRHLHGETLERHSQIQQEAADKYAELERVANSRYGQLQDASKKHSELEQTHGLHLSRLENEHSVVLRNAAEARRRLEEEMALRLRSVQEDCDLKMRQIEEAQCAKLKQCCSRAVLSLVGGRSKGLRAIAFEGWRRAVEKAVLEGRYAQEIAQAEINHKAMEGEWRAHVADLNASQTRIEEGWRRRLEEAEAERERVIQKIEDGKRVTSRDRANKAAFAMIGGHSQRFLLVALHGWKAAATRAKFERDLEAQLRGVEEHQAEIVQERDSQLQRLVEERKKEQLMHEEQMRRLAADEGDKLRRLQEQHDNRRDELEERIKQHEDTKVQIAQAEMKHKALDEEWRAHVAQLNAAQTHIEEGWRCRLEEAETERERVIQEIENGKRVTSRDRANKAAFAMIGGHSQRFLLVALHGWISATTRAKFERDLEAQLRGVEEHQAEIVQERDSQLQRLAEERKNEQLMHEEQLRRLAADEGDKLLRLQEQYDNRRDELEEKQQIVQDPKTEYRQFAFNVPTAIPGAIMKVTAPDGIELKIQLPRNVEAGMKLVMHRGEETGGFWRIKCAEAGDRDVEAYCWHERQFTFTDRHQIWESWFGQLVRLLGYDGEEDFRVDYPGFLFDFLISDQFGASSSSAKEIPEDRYPIVAKVRFPMATKAEKKKKQEVQMVRTDRQDGPKSSAPVELLSRDGVIAPVIGLVASDPHARYASPARFHQLAQGGNQLRSPSFASMVLSESTCLLDGSMTPSLMPQRRPAKVLDHIFNLCFMPQRRLGITAKLSTGVVDMITPGLQAERAGVKVGWQITAVNGQPYSEELLDAAMKGTDEYMLSFSQASTVSAIRAARANPTVANRFNDLSASSVVTRLQHAAEALASRLRVRKLQANVFTAWIQFVAGACLSAKSTHQAVVGRTIQIVKSRAPSLKRNAIQ